MVSNSISVSDDIESLAAAHTQYNCIFSFGLGLRVMVPLSVVDLE